MTRPLLICLDGAKGVGKTTLLEAVTHALRRQGHTVVRLSERNHDPQRAETMALVNACARHPDAELEWRICQRLADSRAWISREVLPEQPPGSLILMDRWFASDAAFRRRVAFADVLQLNVQRGVQVPDLQVGVVTDPHLSWARAQARRQGLRSTVVQAFEDHVACSQAFERVIGEQGWLQCRNDGALAVAATQLLSAVHVVLERNAGN
ncbi:dTMP kinase [Pseudomonas cremoricolorata]|uniref:Thymidylate kinase n=1 Tax=Pseudomonas cremoricolorata TaxID=157783 RepID=A0A089WV34_9PSED|nr:dTMP kinase [Pseudomonas cremoricolorata]AIR91069.1 thymidylate kinase [Pseudomonas cremoricolorata]